MLSGSTTLPYPREAATYPVTVAGILINCGNREAGRSVKLPRRVGNSRAHKQYANVQQAQGVQQNDHVLLRELVIKIGFIYHNATMREIKENAVMVLTRCRKADAQMVQRRDGDRRFSNRAMSCSLSACRCACWSCSDTARCTKRDVEWYRPLELISSGLLTASELAVKRVGIAIISRSARPHSI